MYWLIFSALFFVEAHAAASLKDAFYAARLNMENIKRAEAVVGQKDERISRARALMLPTISGVGSYTKIDPPNGAGASPFLLTRQYSGALRMVQPLLRGGVMASYNFAKEDLLLAEFQKNASELSLYQLVINAYYSLIVAQNDQKNLTELINFSRERVKELKERTKIGRSRRGELVQAEAQFLTSESLFQQGVFNLHQAEKNYQFYTNLPIEELTSVGELPKSIEPLTEYQSKLKTRPDIMVAQQQVVLADQQISIAKGGHFPSLDFVGNYYLTRTGILATSDWDAGLVVSIPLYQGGGVSAAVKESVQIKRVSQLDSQQTLRAAERDLAISYQNYVQIHEQLDTFRAATAKAEESYRLGKRDYEYGQVTNLDLLQSLNLYIETKRSYDNLKSLAQMAYKNLEATIGVLP